MKLSIYNLIIMSESAIIWSLGWSSYQCILSPLLLTHNLWLLIVCVNSYDLWLKNTNVLSVSAILMGYHYIVCMFIWFINCYLCSCIFIEGQVLEISWLCINMWDLEMGWVFFCVDGLHLYHVIFGNVFLCLVSRMSWVLKGSVCKMCYVCLLCSVRLSVYMQWVYWHLLELLWLLIYYVLYV
jgi:heme/copper-type cytochrome/quinol oxidase subunit 3